MLKKYFKRENFWLLFWGFPSFLVTISWLFSIYIWVLRGFPVPFQPYGLEVGHYQFFCAKFLLFIGFIPRIWKKM